MQLIAPIVELNTTDPLDNVTLSVLSVSDILQNLIPRESLIEGKPKKQNVRRDLLNELYQIYLDQCNKEYYVNNKKRYNFYLRLLHPNVLTKNVTKVEYDAYKNEFRKAKLPEHQRFLKPIESKDYLWWGRFSHLKGEDGNESLRTMISTAKDLINRKLDPIPYILGGAGKLSHEKSS